MSRKLNSFYFLLKKYKMVIYIKYNLEKKEYKFNSFEEIPNYDKVVYLNCSNNQLSNLPKLPKTLTELNCKGNQLSNLPELPKTLTTLWCSYNQFIKKDNYDDYLIDKIIYALSGTQDLNIFIDLVLDYLLIKCQDCNLLFIPKERYRIDNEKTVKTGRCSKCLEN